MIDVIKNLEIRTAYLEHRTAHFEDVANITIDSASIITQEKQNGDDEYCQVNTYDENEANKSIEGNTSKKN